MPKAKARIKRAISIDENVVTSLRLTPDDLDYLKELSSRQSRSNSGQVRFWINRAREEDAEARHWRAQYAKGKTVEQIAEEAAIHPRVVHEVLSPRLGRGQQ